jgi:ABC-type transport system involved in multi-copper enzyme maturation permease subunit
LFAGPIIARELLTAPRPLRYYATRASYAVFLLIVMVTAWQALVGWSEGDSLGILSRFGAILFSYFSIIQISLMLFFAPLAAATSVSQEKDRRTFILLLMTDLSDTEIVVGKLAASLLQILTLLATSAPVFLLCVFLGGVSPGQVLDVFIVTAVAGLAGGAVGLTVALWRDRTFQSLALTVLMVVLIVSLASGFSLLIPEGSAFSRALSPFQALSQAIRPEPGGLIGPINQTTLLFALVGLGFTILVLGFAVFMLRKWNPGRNEPREQREEEGQVVTISEIEQGEATTGQLAGTTGLHVPRRSHRRYVREFKPYRAVWTNPIIWRELMTRAYGNKPLIIKGAYVLAFLVGTAAYLANITPESGPWQGVKAMIPPLLAILSLILINAQGVTALTSERDTGALDLLLVTELSPKQFIYGKLFGVLYNTKEMLILPILLTLYLCWRGYVPIESTVFILIDFLLLAHFSAMLGLHAAITYTNSRQAIANSLGTIFFLMLGILLCAGLIIQSNQSFGRQLLSFLIFIGAGSVALYGSLGSRNPSPAIGLVALMTPFWSFYCIISLLQGDFLAAFLFSIGVYGFALLAMLVPAVSDFDIALGRTNAIQG